MKPTSTYKMSKSSKRILAKITDREVHSAFKRFIINAELSAAVVPVKREKKD